MNRWAKSGVMDRAFAQLEFAQVVQIKIEAVSLDSTSVKVHPDGTGARKNGPQAIGKSCGGWNIKIHLLAADARTAVTFSLSPGQAHDALEGREFLRRLAAFGVLVDFCGILTRQLRIPGDIAFKTHLVSRTVEGKGRA